MAEMYANTSARDSSRPPTKLTEAGGLSGTGLLSYTLRGLSTNGDATVYTTTSNQAPAWGMELAAGEELQFPCPPYPNTNWSPCLQLEFKLDGTKINSISNIKIKFEYIRLLARSGNTTTVRDWVSGEEIGEIDVQLQAGMPTTGVYTTVAPPNRNTTLPPPKSVKRIDGHLKSSANTTATQRTSMRSWSPCGLASWVSSTAPEKVSSNSTTGNTVAYPSTTQNNDIPGDPTKTDSNFLYAFDPAENHLDSNDWPKIQFTNPANGTGVFTSPADLGKIQTNTQHRKLRFTTQHPKEVATGSGGTGSQTFIPDWAMLDVISFGSNATKLPPPAPLNLNGKFCVPPASPQPAARQAGLEAALKALDSATLLGNSFNASNTATTNRTQYIGASGNVSSTIVGNIGTLTWSTGNFTSGNSTWGKGNSTADPGSRRKTAGFPTNQFVLPSEVTEIRSVSDVSPLDSYTSSSPNIKGNEGRLSALFPGATTQSRFFTIYAFAQGVDKNGAQESETLIKTLVEIEEKKPLTTPPSYIVKKLYAQPIQPD